MVSMGVSLGWVWQVRSKWWEKLFFPDFGPSGFIMSILSLEINIQAHCGRKPEKFQIFQNSPTVWVVFFYILFCLFCPSTVVKPLVPMKIENQFLVGNGKVDRPIKPDFLVCFSFVQKNQGERGRFCIRNLVGGLRSWIVIL